VSAGLLGVAGVAGAAHATAHVVAASAPTTTTTTVPCVVTASRVQGVCSAANSLHIPVAYRSILPILVLAIGALLLLTISAVLPKRSRPGLYAWLTALISVGAGGVSLWQWSDLHSKRHPPEVTIGGQIFYDKFSVFFMLLISIATLLGALVSDSYLRREGLDGVEAYVLMLMAATGAMLMAASAGSIMLFLGLEIMSIALYVMAAYHRRRVASGEAGFKYFILGSFSSAIFLYGVALVYGATGSTQFGEIATFLARNNLPHDGVLLAGMGLMIVGLGFKVAAVPFHFWTPDVYQGSPTPFTGYMAAVAKAAGFAGLLRVLNQALSTQQANWRPVIWLLAVLTLLIGSVLAIAQKDLKRMFAYSSISQAGYVLVGVQAASASGTSGALFYLFTYTFIVIGTFAVIALIQGPGEARNDLGAIRGLSRRRPGLALAMLVFLLAQAGIPLTSGFLAKFYVIQASVERGQYPLAIIAMLAAAVAAFFYLRVALLMYQDDAPPATPPVGAGVPVAAGSAMVGAGAPVREPMDPAELAGLEPIPSLDGAEATATIAEGPEGTIVIPWAVTLSLAICVIVTIGAGVSAPVIDFARQAVTLF
jgi:NADH-quinone oxidoreductase subunit N